MKSRTFTDVICNKGVTEKELISFAYALEKKSEHPLAKAIVAYGTERGRKPQEDAELAERLAQKLMGKE